MIFEDFPSSLDSWFFLWCSQTKTIYVYLTFKTVATCFAYSLWPCLSTVNHIGTEFLNTRYRCGIRGWTEKCWRDFKALHLITQAINFFIDLANRIFWENFETISQFELPIFININNHLNLYNTTKHEQTSICEYYIQITFSDKWLVCWVKSDTSIKNR